MKLAELLTSLTPTGLSEVAFPRHLLGAFRRRSVTFATGLTDETTVVYWFQSRSFTIDLRLPDAAQTCVSQRQGWIGDTCWNAERRELSWNIVTSYQPRNQWSEPARLHFIGNSVIEFAPSGAYVEDWRQQATTGPLLGLRLMATVDHRTGEQVPADGGLILAGDHAAYAQARSPDLNDRWGSLGDLGQALASAAVTESQIESYEVSVAAGSDTIAYTTQPRRLGQVLMQQDFQLDRDGTVTMSARQAGAHKQLSFAVDLYEPHFTFGNQTDVPPEARAWLAREQSHLMKNVIEAR